MPWGFFVFMKDEEFDAGIRARLPFFLTGEGCVLKHNLISSVLILMLFLPSRSWAHLDIATVISPVNGAERFGVRELAPRFIQSRKLRRSRSTQTLRALCLSFAAILSFKFHRSVRAGKLNHALVSRKNSRRLAAEGFEQSAGGAGGSRPPRTQGGDDGG